MQLRGRRRAPRFPPPPAPDAPGAITRAALAAARRHGFVAAGVVRAVSPAPTWDRFRSWLDEGRHGEMSWLERDAEARSDPTSILPFCRSILSVAREVPPGPAGNVALYARGDDYHDAIRRDLHRIARHLSPACPGGTRFRACVDTAPLLEREIAVRSGVGFVGKSGMLIVPGVGSHVLLGELLTDVEMEPTPPLAGLPASPDRCGTCTACLDSCPTGAFVAPALLDARRCLSYLTIEKRSPFDADEEAALGGRLFGCDVCQDVCPFNARHAAGTTAGAAPASLDPAELLDLDEAEFQERFGGSAIRRATREGLARNARAALASAPVPARS